MQPRQRLDRAAEERVLVGAGGGDPARPADAGAGPHGLPLPGVGEPVEQQRLRMRGCQHHDNERFRERGCRVGAHVDCARGGDLGRLAL
jgi:hypothetical protein